MRKLILCLTLLICGAAALSAQKAPEELLLRKGSNLILNQTKLSAEQKDSLLLSFGGDSLVTHWSDLARSRKTGTWLVSAGSATAGLGALTFLGTGAVYLVVIVFAAPIAAMGDNPQEAVDGIGRQFRPWFLASGIAMLAGAGVAAGGIPLLVKSNREMNRIVGDYNMKNTPGTETELKLSLAPGGIGLVYKF